MVVAWYTFAVSSRHDACHTELVNILLVSVCAQHGKVSYATQSAVDSLTHLKSIISSTLHVTGKIPVILKNLCIQQLLNHPVAQLHDISLCMFYFLTSCLMSRNGFSIG